MDISSNKFLVHDCTTAYRGKYTTFCTAVHKFVDNDNLMTWIIFVYCYIISGLFLWSFTDLWTLAEYWKYTGICRIFPCFHCPRYCWTAYECDILPLYMIWIASRYLPLFLHCIQRLLWKIHRYIEIIRKLAI